MKKMISIICIMLVLMTMSSPVMAAKKDTTAPVITKTNPVDCGTDIMIESTIVIRFNEAIKKDRNIAKISLKENETKSVAFTYEIADHFMEITPKKTLKYNTLYTVTIPANAIKDSAGNHFKTAYSFNFLTEKDPKAAAAPTVSDNATTYLIEIEATLEDGLDETKITYFEQMLQKFGINATFKGIQVVEPK